MNDSTRRQILSLGGAGLVARGIAIFMPVVLVRLLDIDTFGQYRYVWLIAGTATLLATLGMPGSLLYFVPRSDGRNKHRFVYQTLLFVVFTGLIAAVIFGPWNPWLPDRMRDISNSLYTVPLFVFLWLLGSVIEVLPNADQRIRWQSFVILASSLFRALIILTTAWVTRDLQAILLAMIVLALFRVALLFYYVARFHPPPCSRITATSFKTQFSFALPLGISSKLFDLRRLGEQWIVAFLFAPSVFSVFSVAANILPLVQLIRKPVQSVILPKMSKAQGLADINSVKLLNKRGNVVVSMVLLPMIALLMILAEVLMTVLFGQNYKGAGLIFQVYLLGVLPQAVEVGSILVAFAQARFMMRVGLIVAVFSLTVSYIGAKTLGPAGAAIGSVVAGFVDLGIRLRRASEVTDTPIKELQDWDNLVVIALAVVASAVVTITVRNALHFESPWLDMSLSTAIFGATYFSVLMLSGSKWVLEALTGTTRDR